MIGDDKNSHYVWIKNINGLFSSKNTNKTKFVCNQCLCKSFSCEETLKAHIDLKLCQSFNVDRTNCIYELPKVGENIMKFTNINNEFKNPFNVIADFEST